MSIRIGNGNKIKKTTISSNNESGDSVIGDQNEIKKSAIGVNLTDSETQGRSWVQRHPIITGIIIAVIAGVIVGVILKFGFWDKIIP